MFCRFKVMIGLTHQVPCISAQSWLSIRVTPQPTKPSFLPTKLALISDLLSPSLNGPIDRVMGHAPSTVYDILEIIWSSQGFISRGTTVYCVRSKEGKEYVLKDYWVKANGHKAAILEKIMSLKIDGIPMLVEKWNIQFNGQDDTTETLCSPVDLYIGPDGELRSDKQFKETHCFDWSENALKVSSYNTGLNSKEALVFSNDNQVFDGVTPYFQNLDDLLLFKWCAYIQTSYTSTHTIPMNHGTIISLLTDAIERLPTPGEEQRQRMLQPLKDSYVELKLDNVLQDTNITPLNPPNPVARILRDQKLFNVRGKIPPYLLLLLSTQPMHLQMVLCLPISTAHYFLYLHYDYFKF
ncbi:hypothetical protein BV22DRAFT_1135408 [Leucogyrophana mollusca]|uniref:Uncharacterized protein n=1 Tax=Leucogyrophana mollusca TaxID=85980 RepID=A0ACB8AW28_9AGAM|nr:hypothetical protein BV22DRAFT_1135408 [Leucogyrophana mollusca]